MNKSTSLYLDFLRVIAAFGVFFVHANLSWFSNNLFLPEQLGHKLVMLFFVLSGFLIAFTVDKKNKGARRYLVDRFSRLYSVVLPALIFTYVLDYVGKHFNPAFYADQMAPDYQSIRFILNVTYLSQIWTLCTKPSTNGPFWSISYEFWYYILFWAYCYINGKKKYLWLLIICVIVGIKILILFPVWVFGVWAYRISNKYQISKILALLTFSLTLITIILMTFFVDFSPFSNYFVFGKPPLFFSSRFVYDWIFGLILAINIYSVSAMSASSNIPEFIEKPIKYFSGITFSLYLYHLPLLIFIGSMVNYNRSSYLQVLALMCAALIIVVVLSQITEKQRNRWKLLFGRIFLRGLEKEITNKKQC